MIVAILTNPTNATRASRVLRIMLVAQLVVGLCLVRVLSAQRRSDDGSVAVQTQRVDNLAEKVRHLEDINIDRRLAVLEQVQNDSRETKLVSYGTALSLVGTLILGLFERRNRKADALDVDELARRIREQLVAK